MTDAAAATIDRRSRENERTVCQAIAEVLKTSATPLSVTEIHEQIVGRSLYHFRAADPLHIVQVQIRRHCKDLKFATAEPMKYFGLASEGKYFLLPRPIRAAQVSRRSSIVPGGRDHVSFDQLARLHQRYLAQLKSGILSQLKGVTPFEFEHFATNLLRAYGFTKLEVTRPSRDGGIDGFGHLRVGLAELCAAFQCKRWNHGSVGIFEVQRFRGAIQGKADQGVFFTTATFSSDAKKESFVRGAVPVVLIDGRQIVDIMIERCVGVTMEALQVPRPALDLAIQADDS